jgi:hypothetical protein
MKAAIAMAVASLGFSQPARADRVRFTGNTTADVTLIKDALHNIVLYRVAKDQCSSLESVEAKILSPSYKPADAATRPEAGKGTYESWTATLCGKPTKVLMTFWPADDGGTMFAITAPYPADAP